VKIALWVTVGVVVVVVLIVAGAAMLGPSAETGPKAGQKVRLHTVEVGELTESVNAPGTVQPRSRVEISAKVSARIIELPYEEGDRVTGGSADADPPVPASVLVRLDATDLEAALASAQARRDAQAAQIQAEAARIDGQRAHLASSQSALDQARRDLARQRQLFESRDISESAVDECQSQFDQLTAEHQNAQHSLLAAERNRTVLEHNLKAADAELARAREDLSYCTIRSPIDGVITRLNAEVGELVVTGTMNNPGTVIIEVADFSEMLVNVAVDEADIGQVAIGQPAEVHMQAYPDQTYHGEVGSVALSTSPNSQSFNVEILLKPTEQRLYAGLTADVDIQTQTHADVLAVPSQAVLGCKVDDLPLELRTDNPNVDMGKTFATVVYRFVDGKAVVTPVTIGASDALNTVIVSGLDAGQQVIVGPYTVLESLKHDQAVQDEQEDVKDTAEAGTAEAPDDAEEAQAQQSDDTGDGGVSP